MDALMNKNPLVSVIMTVYNTEKYLAEAVKSILNQTLKDFEFIIIDDGSRDASAQLLDSFTDPRIRVFKSAENRGLIYQSNKALEIARGKYIARMDSDDISLSERLEAQVAYLEEHKEIGLCGTYLKYFDDSKIYTKSILPVSNDAIGTFYLFSNSVVHSTVMFRKSLIDEHKIQYPTNVRAGGDIAFLTLLFEFTQFSNIPKVFFRCRIRKSSVTRLHNSVQAEIGYHVKLKFLNRFLSSLDEKRKGELEKMHLDIIAKKINSKKDLKALMSWLDFLFNQNMNLKIFNKSGFVEGISHFVYRQLVRDGACTISNFTFMTWQHHAIVWAWPFQFKIIFLSRSIISLFSKGKI